MNDYKYNISSYKSKNIDEIDIECDKYLVEREMLEMNTESDTLFINSNLLKSNCLVTGQPDWGSIEIFMKGEVPTEESLLKYIVSFRTHNEFHEQCIERIINDLTSLFNCESILVKGNYVRRGGIDINPIRSFNYNEELIFDRKIRQ